MSLRSTELRKWERRGRRAYRVRRKARGTSERPRLSVYRSHRHFHAQIIDDLKGLTLAAASTQQKDLSAAHKNGGDAKAAVAVGKKIAEVAKEKGISQVVFDRGFYKFHGRVKAFAEAASAGGLGFLTVVDPKKLARKKARGPKKKGKGEAKGEQKKDKKKKKDKKPKKEKQT